MLTWKLITFYFLNMELAYFTGLGQVCVMNPTLWLQVYYCIIHFVTNLSCSIIIIHIPFSNKSYSASVSNSPYCYSFVSPVSSAIDQWYMIGLSKELRILKLLFLANKSLRLLHQSRWSFGSHCRYLYYVRWYNCFILRLNFIFESLF